MPLATPSNIAISRLHRIFNANSLVTDSRLGAREFGPQIFYLYGNVTWTNTESGAHAVVLSIDGRETLLTKGASSAKNVLLTTYVAPATAAKSITVVVRLRQGAETAEASASFSVDGMATAGFSGAASLAISGNDLLIPEWTGAVNALRVKAQTEGSQAFPNGLSVNSVDPYTLSPYVTNLRISLADATENRMVPYSEAKTPLGGLIQGQTYRARYEVSNAVTVKTESYQQGWYFSTAYGQQYQTRFLQTYVTSGTLMRELFFVAPAPVIPFVAQGATLRAVRNIRLRRKLEANYRATWAISSGNPGGFGIEYVPLSFGTAAGPDEAYLVGTPLVSGSFTIGLTATRADAAETTTATVNLTVVESLPKTVVTTNSAIAREGVVTSTADVVNIAFQSTPAPATWAATGLPPGVSISQDGTISGTPTRPGVFFASVTAQAEDFDVSLPTTIKFTVGLADGTILTSAAALRSPWLLAQWELTDIHIAARTRVVDSTMMENGTLRLKTGDATDFAIFFIDTNDAVFALAPSELRMTIRKADNLDERIVYKSAASPTAVTQEGQTYYLLSVTTSNRERETVLEWAEENGKNEPLSCVADVDWVKNGKQYSSRSFPVLLELDVTRP